jgi:Retrotransposon gag protein
VKPKNPSPFGAAKSFKGRLTVLTTEEAAQIAENDENHLLKDFAASKAIGIQLGYKVPNVAANNFELKPALLNMLSQHMFNDLAHEDPNQHLAMIKELCNTVKINGVEPEAIKLRAFSFSLGDKVRNWLRSLNTDTIRIWAQMSDVFLSKYFLPSKTYALCAQIINFRQKGGESFSEACDRYQELLHLCPHHILEKWFILQIFYERLEQSSKLTIDAAEGGKLMNMSAHDSYKLIDEMTLGQQQWSSVREPVRGALDVIETDISSKLAAQLEAMQKSIDRLTNQNISAVHQSPTCAIYGGGDHLAINYNWGEFTEEDMKQVNEFNNNFRLQNNPYSNTYNPSWRNYPNFYKDNQPQNPNQHPNQNRPIQGYGQRQFDQGALQKSNLEQMMERVMRGQEEFMQYQRRINQQVANQINDLSIRIDLLTTQGKMLETQVTQLGTPPARQ